MPHQPLDQHPLAEWPVDDHCHSALGGERQKTLLDFAIDRIVAELYEVNVLAPHNFLEGAEAPPLCGGDADVAHAPMRLHRLQRFKVGAPVEEVMNLNEIETIDAPEFARGLHLLHAKRLEHRPYLGGGEQWALSVGVLETVPNHRLGRAVHWRRIDQSPTAVEERLHDSRTIGALPFVTADIEGEPGAQADGGNLLARGGNRAHQDRPGGGAAFG